MAFQKKKKNGPAPFSFLTEPTLFEPDEATFLDTVAKRRVYVQLVPAPWSRVILLSLLYALGINFVKLAWFELFGRPSWYATDAATASLVSSGPKPLYQAYPTPQQFQNGASEEQLSDSAASNDGSVTD